jgi:hypothetical protein
MCTPRSARTLSDFDARLRWLVSACATTLILTLFSLRQWNALRWSFMHAVVLPLRLCSYVAAVCGAVFASPNASQIRRGIDLVDNEKG